MQSYNMSKHITYPRKFIITKCSTKLHKTKSAKARSGGKSCKSLNKLTLHVKLENY
ncbi:hypothetical protein Hanom_Chr04g00303231 [Helianthus anomalus]